MTREEAIEQLESLLAHCESMRNDDGLTWGDDCEALKIALSAALQAETEGMRSNWYKSVEKIQKLRAELEQVKHQRDSYRLYHDDLASKPNCNTCADKDCKYRPIPGDTVRANCPLWRGSEEG